MTAPSATGSDRGPNPRGDPCTRATAASRAVRAYGLGLAALALSLGPSAALADPEQLHLSFGDAGPQTAMIATWRSAASSGACRVGTSTTYEVGTFAATPVAYAAAQASSSPPHVLTAEMTGLAADTVYHYQCGSSALGYSGDQTFRTAPSPASAAPVRFAVFGDAQTYSAEMEAHRARLVGVMQARQSTSPPYAFLLGNGDFCDRGGLQAEWDGFFRALAPLAATAPLMPSIAGHEYVGPTGRRTAAPEYFGQFVLPTHPPATGYEDEGYYSFDWGSLHVISLGEPTDPTGTGPQTSWLRDDLVAASANPQVRWIVSFHHLPPYSAGQYSASGEVTNHWAKPLLEQYGVAVHFQAHNHNYQRSKPIKNGVVVSSGGTVYVGAGGMSTEATYPCNASYPMFEKCLERRSFADVLVEPGRLVLTAVAEDGSAIDSFTLAKPVQGCSDGTADGRCSATKPLRCSAGSLVDACALCGCPGAGDVCSAPTGRCAAPKAWRAAMLSSEPQVDGRLDEYASLEAIALNGGDAAGSALVKVGWTSQALHLAYAVRDDQLLPAAGGEEALWDGDGVELMLDPLLDRAATAVADDVHVVVTSAGLLGDARAWTDFAFASGASQAVERTAGGYSIELRLPFSALGLSPVAGKKLGFDVAANDRDPGTATRPTDWAGLTAFNQPSGWGVLELAPGSAPPSDAGASAPLDAAAASDSAVPSPGPDASPPVLPESDGGTAGATDGGGVPDPRGSCGCGPAGEGVAGLATPLSWLLLAARLRRRRE